MAHWRTHHKRRRRLALVQIGRRRDALEERIYDEQCKLIDETYGEGTDANLGWAVTGDDERISVATKVYVEDRPILQSVGYYKTGKIGHEWC